MTVNPVCGCLAFYLGTAGDLRYKTEVVEFLCCEVAANAWKECGSKRTGCTASTMGGGRYVRLSGTFASIVVVKE